NRLKALKSAAIEVGFKFIEGFTGKAGGAITDFTEKLRKFDVESIVKGIGKAFKILKPWLKAAYDVFKVLKYVLPFVVVGIVAFTVAQWNLNAALAANPVGAVVIALWAMVAVAIIVVRYWDEITAALRAAWNWINNIFNNPALRIAMAMFAQPLLIILGIIQTIVDLLSGKGWKSFLNLGGPIKAFTDILGITKAGGQWRDTEKERATAMSSNIAMLESRSTVTNRSTLDVNFSNPPAGMTAKQKGKSPDINLDLGLSGVRF
ncbi:hypothetical protein LCGC14_2422160, partial [marine sediment metagenome]